MDFVEELFKELTEAKGPSGHERDVAEVMRKHLADCGEVTRDRLGSVICRKEGTAAEPKIMLAGHMDEVGFMVKSITKEGFIKFLPLGGWWGHVALAQQVVVRASKGDVIGVIGSKPPHDLKDEERKKVMDLRDMFIDVGATSYFDVEKKLGIKPGDVIVPHTPFQKMSNPRLYLAKAWDDRVGCALVLQVLKALKRVRHPNTVYGVGTVQEEVGLRGAQTSAATIDPDVGFALEVGIAQDIPGVSGEQVAKLGAGTAILVYDATMIPNSALRDLVVDTAKKRRLPYHFSCVERGGTDAGRIHMNKMGVPSVVLGVNARYIHSHSGIIDRKDFDNTVKLIVEVIKALDKKKVASLTA